MKKNEFLINKTIGWLLVEVRNVTSRFDNIAGCSWIWLRSSSLKTICRMRFMILMKMHCFCDNLVTTGDWLKGFPDLLQESQLTHQDIALPLSVSSESRCENAPHKLPKKISKKIYIASSTHKEKKGNGWIFILEHIFLWVLYCKGKSKTKGFWIEFWSIRS